MKAQAKTVKRNHRDGNAYHPGADYYTVVFSDGEEEEFANYGEGLEALGGRSAYTAAAKAAIVKHGFPV